MSKILAIDSSTEACSVALEVDGKVFSRFQIAPRRHAELLLPMVDEVLKEGNTDLNCLDAIACCVGPGAFTGLRIAISVAQGLSFAASMPCIPVSSLETLAYQAFETGDNDVCLAAIDARMQEVYFGSFEPCREQLIKPIFQETVISPAALDVNQILPLNQSVVKVGNGWANYQFNEAIENSGVHDPSMIYPDAKWMIPIAISRFRSNSMVKPEFLQPVYLRNNVAVKKSAKN